MYGKGEHRQIILVLDDIEETRSLLKKMLSRNGSCIMVARNEEDAVTRARSNPPDLILISLGLELKDHLLAAQRIRLKTGFGPDIAIVLFSIPTIPEGAEVEVEKSIYAIRPDNFDQLRGLLKRLLKHH